MINCDFNCQCEGRLCYGQPKTKSERKNRKVAAKKISENLIKNQPAKDKLYASIDKSDKDWQVKWVMNMKPLITNDTF